MNNNFVCLLLMGAQVSPKSMRMSHPFRKLKISPERRLMLITASTGTPRITRESQSWTETASGQMESEQSKKKKKATDNPQSFLFLKTGNNDNLYSYSTLHKKKKYSRKYFYIYIFRKSSLTLNIMAATHCHQVGTGSCLPPCYIIFSFHNIQ